MLRMSLRTPRAGAPPETLLVVEDEPDMLEIESDTLSELGYQVLSAPSGPDAIAVAARHPTPIDLLVTDVVMPGMNGWQLATRLRSTQPRMRELFVSGFAVSVISSHGVPPDVRLLRKPFSHSGLAQAVRDALDQGGPARS